MLRFTSCGEVSWLQTLLAATRAITVQRSINKLGNFNVREINVAISLHISNKPGSSIWSNGAVQHTIFLYQLFKRIPYVKNVWLGTYDDTEIGDKWLLGEIRDAIVPMESVIGGVDLLVEMSRYVTEQNVQTVKNRGGKFVSYKFGPDYAMITESLLFGGHQGWVPNPSKLIADVVWMNGQYMNTSKGLQSMLYSSKVSEVSHLWSPYFLELAIKSNEKSAKGWPYQPTKKIKPVSVFEPNINVVKTSLVPFLIAAAFYDKRQDSISNIFLYNTLKLVDHPVFKRIVLGTAAGRDRVATAEKRYSFVDAMGQKGGVVLSHQWENALNYLYYEALYGGFPLVHNSPFLRDVGYYYEGFDVEDGVRALERAIFEHDKNLETYRENANAFLATVDPASEQVIAEYDREVRRLFS